ncbi:flavin-containing monooxygenase [Rhodococcus opacus]|uniref:flavin-containing monooxygenase n=1 Tax=Rhodococcus opacus TaxID=37919 RepID=UPI002235EFB0|nr:FAD-dependent oxidoreductase [Rhodococcus opacus]UZG60222.1 FAD-dependent oxidoreductase [Rhodococcus opacus]
MYGVVVNFGQFDSIGGWRMPENEYFMSDNPLRAAQEAEPGVLAAVLTQLTGDLSWADDPRLATVRERGGEGWDSLPADCQRYLADASDALRRFFAGNRHVALSDPDDATLLEIARRCIAEEITLSDVAKLRHHLFPESLRVPIDSDAVAAAGICVTIVGAGLSGLSLAFELERVGIDYTILEKEGELGGVWLDNIYPDCGVDTPAFQYAFDAMPNFGWSRFDAKRDEVLAYLTDAATKAGVLDRIQFGVDVGKAVYDERVRGWSLEVTRQGEPATVQTDVLVAAVGSLNRPKIPEIPGLDEFSGIAVHTARWSSDIDLAGKRVALVGNGSSGTQLGRAIASEAERLIAFQRSPHWIRPRGRSVTGPVGEGKRWLLESVPNYYGWYRFFLDYVMGDRDHPRMVRQETAEGLVPSPSNDRVRQELTDYIREQVKGREDLIEKLTPQYAPYGKRLVIDNGWYDTLTRPNVELVTSGIERVDQDGIVTEDGVHHQLDAIIFATGFHGTRYFWPLEIVGTSGLTLAQTHGGAEDLRAYLGTAMPGYPNFFALQGPNSTIGHGGGATFISECQGRLIMSCLKGMIEEGLEAIDIRQDVADQYNSKMDAQLDRMVWSESGLDSRFKNPAGRIVSTHPWTLRQFWELTSSVQLDAFQVERATEAAQ